MKYFGFYYPIPIPIPRKNLYRMIIPRSIFVKLSKMERFTVIVNRSLAIVTKLSILNVRGNPKYTSEVCPEDGMQAFLKLS